MTDSKEHIITVACKLFLQKSFKEVTMKDIVEKTGLSKGAFYHYFKSKEQLFMEVLDFFFTQVMRHAYENYSKESFYQFYHDYAKEVMNMITKYLDKFTNDFTEAEFSLNYFTLAFDAIKLFPEFRKTMLDGQHAELEVWKSVLKTARERGEIKSIMTDEQIAQTFLYVSDGIAMHMILEGAKVEEMINPFLTIWNKLYELMKV